MPQALSGIKPLISVLVPVYNWNLHALLETLVSQMRQLPVGMVELIVVDDCSPREDLRQQNREVCRVAHEAGIRLLELNENVGRSRIRNVLAKEACGEYLLFMDSDVLPDGPDFLAVYCESARQKRFDALCGGISYKSRTMAGLEYDFFLYLSGHNDVKPAAERNQVSWRYLHTANILIRRDVFWRNLFDERFSGYGYEDCEWGIRLCRDFRVTHIDNPVSHLGLVAKSEQFQRMRTSMVNYLLLTELHPAEFKGTKLDQIVRLLSLFPVMVLDALDSVISTIFRTSNSNWLLYRLYQFDKAVIMAAKIRCNHARSVT